MCPRLRSSNLQRARKPGTTLPSMSAQTFLDNELWDMSSMGTWDLSSHGCSVLCCPALIMHHCAMLRHASKGCCILLSWLCCSSETCNGICWQRMVPCRMHRTTARCTTALHMTSRRPACAWRPPAPMQARCARCPCLICALCTLPMLCRCALHAQPTPSMPGIHERLSHLASDCLARWQLLVFMMQSQIS